MGRRPNLSRSDNGRLNITLDEGLWPDRPEPVGSGIEDGPAALPVAKRQRPRRRKPRRLSASPLICIVSPELGDQDLVADGVSDADILLSKATGGCHDRSSAAYVSVWNVQK
jgi:hypothetical protein